MCRVCVEVIGQFARLRSLLPPCGRILGLGLRLFGLATSALSTKSEIPNLWVVTPLEVAYQIHYVLDIYVKIYNSSRITATK